MAEKVAAVTVRDGGVFLRRGRELVFPGDPAVLPVDRDGAARGTIAHGILAAHHEGLAARDGTLQLRFDALASHDITYVGIIQTARACGLESFPVPYVLTCCHNSLCAVGGTINADDHVFGLSAAKKYGGLFVPPHTAVIHSYMREVWAACGSMILGSDSHTRYGALGTLAVGEGGGELVKQLLCQRYQMAYPRVVAVFLEGKPPPGVGPMDAALALIGAVFPGGFAKNAVLEFTGPGIAALPQDFRNGLDVMTTETACWSSVWETDETTRAWLALHGREDAYRPLVPAEWAYYDALVRLDLSRLRPMIALPFHPSNAVEIAAFLEAPSDMLRQIEKDAVSLSGRAVETGLTAKVDGKGRVHVDQGIIAGCAGGTFDNIMAAADILCEAGPRADWPGLSVYPGSQSIYVELARNGALAHLAASGAVVKTAFCGPCFGAGDAPPHRGLSVRHTTRNFPSREGSRPNEGQFASVALMDARSVAATARNGGILTSAEDAACLSALTYPYRFDDAPYRARVYNGIGKAGAGELVYGPNIADWPQMPALKEHLLLKIAAFITDPVTTTDELIPSGETSSYRSNPAALAEFTLRRKDPAYVPCAKALKAAALELAGAGGIAPGGAAGDNAGAGNVPGVEAARAELLAARAELLAARAELLAVLAVPELAGFAAQGRETAATVQIASALFAVKPGDGSAREQAASCQRVLGGAANFANEYATKRYRSNLVNWGLIPFVLEGTPPFVNGDYVFIPHIAALIRGEKPAADARIIRVRAGTSGGVTAEGAGTFVLAAPELNAAERELLLAGSLINYNRYNREKAREKEAGT